MTSPTPVEGGEGALLAAYRASLAVAGRRRRRPSRRRPGPIRRFGTPGRVAERHELPADIGATAVRFANGVRLTVKQTDFAANQVLVAVRFGHGQLDLPTDRPESGLGARPGLHRGRARPAHLRGDAAGAEQPRLRRLARHRRGCLHLRGHDPAARISRVQMQVLAAYVTDPGWRPTGWDRLRALERHHPGPARLDPERRVQPRFGRSCSTMATSAGRCPTRDQMAASTIADARAVLDAPLAHGPIEVIIVGDISVDEAIRADRRHLRRAAAARPAAPAPAAQIRFPAGHAPSRCASPIDGRADQGLAFIGWPTQGFYDDPREARALSLLASSSSCA